MRYYSFSDSGITLDHPIELITIYGDLHGVWPGLDWWRVVCWLACQRSVETWSTLHFQECTEWRCRHTCAMQCRWCHRHGTRAVRRSWPVAPGRHQCYLSCEIFLSFRFSQTTNVWSQLQLLVNCIFTIIECWNNNLTITWRTRTDWSV